MSSTLVRKTNQRHPYEVRGKGARGYRSVGQFHQYRSMLLSDNETIRRNVSTRPRRKRCNSDEGSSRCICIITAYQQLRRSFDDIFDREDLTRAIKVSKRYESVHSLAFKPRDTGKQHMRYKYNGGAPADRLARASYAKLRTVIPVSIDRAAPK